MNFLPKRLSHPAALPAFVLAFLVVIAALAGLLFTRSQAALMNGGPAADKPARPQSKQSAREADSPTLSIGDIKIIRADGSRAASAQGDMAIISIASAGWQPGETVEFSIYRAGAGMPDATFNLVADKKGRIIKPKLMLYIAANGLTYMSAVGLESGRLVTKKFDMEVNGGPFVNTYDATCTTGDSEFVLGDTVCAQVTGIDPKLFNARFDWVDPDGIIQEMGPTIVMNNQTDTFLIPAMGPAAKTGTWQVRITNQNDGSTLASVGFIVSEGGPQPEAIATFQSDCATPQSSFVGGATVCAKVTGIDAGEENTFNIIWRRPDNSVARTGPVVTMNDQTDSFTIPTEGPGGTWTVELTRLSDGSVQASASFTVTVTPCSIICPDNTTVSNDPNDCGAVVNYALPFTEGDCGKVTCSPSPGSRFPVGTTTVTCDAANTKAMPDCTFTVTVNDTQAPSITCPKSFTQPTDPNKCTAMVNYNVPTASDNCPCGAKGLNSINGGGSCPVMCDPPPGSTLMVGMTTVTCMATDASGNKASCSFTVTVKDMQAPSITCPKSFSVSNTPGQCGATPTFPTPSTAAGTLSDNCPGVTAMCSPASGSPFSVGTTTVTCTATDASGNKASCSFTITVNDTQPPSITCPANVTAVTGQTCPPPAGVVVTFATPSVAAGTVSDNCPNPTVMCSPASGSTFPVGTTTVTCTATDASGNTATCSFTVTAFNACLQDDARPNNVVLFNTFTGEYRYCCGATVRLAGRGSVIQQGCIFTLQHNAPDRRLFAKIDFTARRGNASLQNFSGPGCTISDTNIRNNTCQCAAP